jgi:ABC-type arginine/histidine transport system permease subunit
MADADADARKQAVKRIKQKRQFQMQLLVFAAVNVLLWVIWAASGFGFPWPIFVTVFWGFGLLTQGWMLYRGARPITEAEIQREMGKDPGVA